VKSISGGGRFSFTARIAFSSFCEFSSAAVDEGGASAMVRSFFFGWLGEGRYCSWIPRGGTESALENTNCRGQCWWQRWRGETIRHDEGWEVWGLVLYRRRPGVWDRRVEKEEGIKYVGLVWIIFRGDSAGVRKGSEGFSSWSWAGWLDGYVIRRGSARTMTCLAVVDVRLLCRGGPRSYGRVDNDDEEQEGVAVHADLLASVSTFSSSPSFPFLNTAANNTYLL